MSFMQESPNEEASTPADEDVSDIPLPGSGSDVPSSSSTEPSEAARCDSEAVQEQHLESRPPRQINSAYAQWQTTDEPQP